ncbi:unnamed protein product [Ectocarpus sp. 6 AP-2014]
MAASAVVTRLHALQDLERAVVQAITDNGGTMLADDLLACFKRYITPGGRVGRLVYNDFIRVVKTVAIKHDSQYFGPSWILKKPPRRGF